MDALTFALRLVAKRKWSGWTQQELADQSGLKRGAIAHYEKGRMLPSIPALLKLCDALPYCTPDLLLGRGAWK